MCRRSIISVGGQSFVCQRSIINAIFLKLLHIQHGLSTKQADPNFALDRNDIRPVCRWISDLSVVGHQPCLSLNIRHVCRYASDVLVVHSTQVHQQVVFHLHTCIELTCCYVQSALSVTAAVPTAALYDGGSAGGIPTAESAAAVIATAVSYDGRAKSEQLRVTVFYYMQLKWNWFEKKNDFQFHHSLSLSATNERYYYYITWKRL